MTEIRDVADGLWLWLTAHPAWRAGDDWDAEVASFAVQSRGASLLLDPLAPPPADREVYERIDASPPDAIVVLKPDHVRDVDLFARWYQADAYGPELYWRDDLPKTELKRVEPGDELPGGLRAHYDGRGKLETPLYLPEQRAIVFADALTAPDGELRVWQTPWHEERVLPELRRLLELDFELVLVSHGDPVHDRGEFEAALGREPYSTYKGA